MVERFGVCFSLFPGPDIMKKLYLASSFALALAVTTPLHASGDGANIPIGTVATDAGATSSSQGIIIPLLLLAIIAAEVAAD